MMDSSLLGKHASGRRIVHITTVAYSLRFLRGHLRFLRDQGYEVHVVSTGGDQLDQIERDDHIAVHRLEMARRIAPLSDLHSLWRLRRLLRQLQPNLVHCHTPKAGLLGTLAARLALAPAVALSIFGLAQMNRRGPMRWLLDATTRLSCRLADWVWADSPSMAKYLLAQRYCRAEKLAVLGDGSVGGIDAEQFDPDRFSPFQRAQLRQAGDIPLDAVVIGFIGRIVRDKGISDLVQAWQQLRARHPQLHLLLVGPFEAGDPLPPEHVALLKTDDRVHLVGMQESVADYLAVMDIFVNPSYREGFGVANAEASAMAIPVVASRIPGCTDSVLDGVTGLLTPAGNSTALAATLERYINQPMLRAEHGEAGRLRILDSFHPIRLQHELLAVYETLLGAAQRQQTHLKQIPLTTITESFHD